MQSSLREKKQDLILLCSLLKQLPCHHHDVPAHVELLGVHEAHEPTILL